MSGDLAERLRDSARYPETDQATYELLMATAENVERVEQELQRLQATERRRCERCFTDKGCAHPNPKRDPERFDLVRVWPAMSEDVWMGEFKLKEEADA